MLNKYYQIYELLQKILKISQFNDVEFSYPMISDHKLLGQKRHQGYWVGIFNVSHSITGFSLQTNNEVSKLSHTSSYVNINTKSCGCSNIQNLNVMDVYGYNGKIPALELSTAINLGTDEGSDAIFQMSTLYPEVLTDCWALLSHYKKHCLSDLYHLGWSGHLPESVLDMMILKLEGILKEI